MKDDPDFHWSIKGPIEGSIDEFNGRLFDGSIDWEMEGGFRLFIEEIQNQLAEDSIHRLRIGEHRIFRMINILFRARHSGLARKFLHMVSRCYLLGLDQECRNACRSALETAIQSVISVSELQARRPDKLDKSGKPKTKWSLHEYLEAAVDDHPNCPRWIKQEFRELAFVIKGAGNEAAHSDADNNDDPLPLIKGLTEILNELEAERARRMK